jgi:lysophospholipase L1-like esterase
VDSLRSMVGSARAARSLPFLATIPPANPAVANGADRNEWVARMNDFIRPMARQEGAVLVDVHAAFTKAGNLTDLFADHVHPNDRGYEIIAGEFFKAITEPVAPASGVALPIPDPAGSAGRPDRGLRGDPRGGPRPLLDRIPRPPGV